MLVWSCHSLFLRTPHALTHRSNPLSPSDVNHFQRAKRASKESAEAAQDNASAFVLVRQGSMEASGNQPLSPSDRKLYYKRQSFSSPKVAPQVRSSAARVLHKTLRPQERTRMADISFPAHPQVGDRLPLPEDDEPLSAGFTP